MTALSLQSRLASKKTGRLFSAVLLLSLLMLMAGCGSTSTGGEAINLVVTPVPSPTPTPHAAPTIPPVTYTVKTGDTLSGIADIFGVTVDDIVHINNIADPNSLSVGQVLTIPGRAPTPTPNLQSPTPGTVTATVTLTVSITPTIPQQPVLPPPDVTPPLGPTISP